MGEPMTTQTDPGVADAWDLGRIEHTDGPPAAPAPLRVVPPPAEDAPVEPVAWEYLTAHGGTNSRDAQTRLNDLGVDGWELVSVVPPHDPSGQTVLYMKRPRTR